jgi:hypothetical protein
MMAIKFKTPKIRTQFLAVMILLTVVISGIFTLYTYTSMRSEMMHSIDRQLLTAADMAHAMLPPNYHDRITNPGSVSAADYLAIVEEYNQLCTDLGLEYLWSLLLIDGQVVFTSATSPDKIALNYKHADFFEVHTNPELYLPTFTKMTPTFQNSDDKWGRIRVALIPYEDEKGRPYLFGASVRLNYVDGILHKMLVQCLIFGMLLIIIALSASFILSYYIARLNNILR